MGGLRNVSDEARELAQRFTVGQLAEQFLGTRGYGSYRRGGEGLPDIGMRSGSTGLHTVSDFASYLSPVLGVILADPTVIPDSPLLSAADRRRVPDFNTAIMQRLDVAADLLPVQEHGEFTRGTFSDTGEAVTVSTFGRILGATRQVIVNDQFGRLSDPLRLFANAAAARIDSLLHLPLLANNGAGQTMSDGFTLFHSSRGNIGTPAALDVAGLSAARVAMRNQKNLVGEPLYIVPKFLLVGPALETQAEQLLTQIAATQVDQVNVFAGKLQLLISPRITDRRWYLIGPPSTLPALVFVELSGVRPLSGPSLQLATRVGFDVDGVEYRATLDAGAGAVHPQAIFFNPGVA